ncbi:MAG: hypothetical protein QM750_28560 [Rubrivivax sp.]
MLELALDKAKVKTVGSHQYYVFPQPATHTNQANRPPTYADPALLVTYTGAGSNGRAKLLPGEVHKAANAMMTALRCYGDAIDDWSMKSAVIASGYRPDDARQGANYLRIIKKTIKANPGIFGELEFPSSLEKDAQSVLGRPGDPRRIAFHQNVAAAPGWDKDLTAKLFKLVDGVYTPRGTNPHATGLVFDLDFTIFDGHKRELSLGANTALNGLALRSAAGMWLNQYSMMFGFDSYDTRKEIWHQEYRSPTAGDGSPEAIELLNCCGPAPD